MPPASSRQRGNILFLILLAVVLFAALSYAVTSGMRGGGKDASSESAKSAAAAILNNATLMQQAVNRLMLTNGCKESELSFEDPYDTGYTNNTRADGSCNLFLPQGGGLEYAVPDANWLDSTWQPTYSAFYGKWFFFNNVCVASVGTGSNSNCWNDGTNTDSDLVVYLPFVTQNVCKAINEGLGIAHMASGDAQHMNGGAIGLTNTYKFKGIFNPSSTMHIWGSGATHGGLPTAFFLQHQGCFRPASSTDTFTANGQYDGFYVFYQVLLAR